MKPNRFYWSKLADLLETYPSGYQAKKHWEALQRRNGWTDEEAYFVWRAAELAVYPNLKVGNKEYYERRRRAKEV